MLIKDFGGEFRLIQSITRKPKQKSVITSIGDDCAVIKNGKKLMLVTTDMLIEGDHFSLDYFSPSEIGGKAIESNLSDIAAMGGKPSYGFIAISLTNKTEIEWVQDFYKAVYKRANKYNFDIVGGDTTHSDQICISITIIGETTPSKLTLRNGAKKGDLIKVTGKLGASTAGYKQYKKKHKGHLWVKSKHKNPKCRLDICDIIATKATSMEDISDGLASEIKNITRASKTGAIIYADKVPIDKRTIDAATSLKDSALDYALFGGEDFELVYTVAPRYAASLPGVTVGEITSGSKLFLETEGKKNEITKSGYNHFSN